MLTAQVMVFKTAPTGGKGLSLYHVAMPRAWAWVLRLDASARSNRIVLTSKPQVMVRRR